MEFWGRDVWGQDGPTGLLSHGFQHLQTLADVSLLLGGHVTGSGSEQGHQHLAELDELTAALPPGGWKVGAAMAPLATSK